MSDFHSLWQQAASNRFDDPEQQKAFEQSRLDMLTTAAVTQALWRAARARFFTMLIGFIVFPPFAFHLAAIPFEEGNGKALAAMGGYVLGCVLVYLVGRRILEGDAEAELHEAIKPALVAEAAFAKKWERRAKFEELQE